MGETDVIQAAAKATAEVASAAARAVDVVAAVASKAVEAMDTSHRNAEKLEECLLKLARIEVHTAAFVTSLETHAKEDDLFQKQLMGNGQPGVIAGLSTRISSLEQAKVWMWGLSIGGGTVLVYIIDKIWG